MKLSTLAPFILLATSPITEGTPTHGPAKQRICAAARKDTITDHTARWQIAEDLQHNGANSWWGHMLATGRYTLFRHSRWMAPDDARNHCARWCLGPAASHGFDAAMCQLTTHGWGSRATVVYSADMARHCSPSTPLRCNVDFRPWTLGQIREQLTDRRHRVPDVEDVWFAGRAVKGVGEVFLRGVYDGKESHQFVPKWHEGFSADPEDGITVGGGESLANLTAVDAVDEEDWLTVGADYLNLSDIDLGKIETVDDEDLKASFLTEE